VTLFITMIIGSFETDELNFKVQSGIGWDQITGSCFAIGILRRANKLGYLTNTHLSDSLIPASDYFAFPKCKSEYSSFIPR
jgi:hypothetical protein